MPPKRATKGTSSQIKTTIANPQAGVDQSTHQQDVQPDAETQVDDDIQHEADVQSSAHASSSPSNVADGAMVSTADDTIAPTPNTEASDAGDAESEAVQKTVVARKSIAGKAVPNVSADGKKKKKKKKKKRKTDPTKFTAYIHKVLKQLDRDGTITTSAMQIMNDFIKDLCIRLADLASDLCKKQKRPTLSAHDFQTATKLILPSGLAKHAHVEGSKALRTYNKAVKVGQAKRELKKKK
ncbi:hypothetical protein E4T39_03035 [Aureobasidium subglaciale]|nr:hypothetical protein E4T39_03035 [Aureobasidium subglaciale]